GGANYAQTHESAVQERDDLGAKLGLVVITVPGNDPATKVRVGAYDVPPDRWGKPYPIEPTTTDVIVQVPGQPPIPRSITVAPGERQDVRLDAPVVVAVPGPAAGEEAPPGGGVNGLRIGAYVAGAVGVGGMVMFAVGGVLANSTYSSLQTLCNNQ